MTFAAEPYGVFVDDLLTGLTGGIARESFVFIATENPFRLTPPGPVRPKTVRVHGIVGEAFHVFRRTVDFTVDGSGILTWVGTGGVPTGSAVWPDDGSTFYVNYEHQGPSGAAPILTDRNPGSVTRLLAESFAREYAVLSGQLEAVYRGAFIETATGRDLDNVVLLVGVTRRDPSFATGAVTFARSTPAPADITIGAGTRISTSEVPAATFETTELATLRRGSLGVDVPIQALSGGSSGVVATGAITAINRPILGISTVENRQPTRFATAPESDTALRERAQRALSFAGRATTAALKGALTRVAGLREKDILISEDPALRPGVVQLDVALPELSPEERDAAIIQALALIEETRPVGIRIRANIDAPAAAGSATPTPNPVPDEGSDPVVLGDVTPDLFMPVDITAVVVPVALGLGNREREDLRAAADAVVRAFVAEAGIGETLIYNRLVAQLMALDGVLDVAVQMRAQSEDPALPARKNLQPKVVSARPTAGVIDVQLGGALVMIDITVTLVLKGAGLLGDADSARQTALDTVTAELRAGVAAFAGTQVTPAAITGLVTTNAETYDVVGLSYKVEYQDDGVRVNQRDVTLPLGGLEQLWVRSVTLDSSGGL
jgi:uncharacterized phage protein gp47/JayE